MVKDPPSVSETLLGWTEMHRADKAKDSRELEPQPRDNGHKRPRISSASAKEIAENDNRNNTG